jgi:hypothetical protein
MEASGYFDKSLKKVIIFFWWCWDLNSAWHLLGKRSTTREYSANAMCTCM